MRSPHDRPAISLPSSFDVPVRTAIKRHFRAFVAEANNQLKGKRISRQKLYNDHIVPAIKGYAPGFIDRITGRAFVPIYQIESDPKILERYLQAPGEAEHSPVLIRMIYAFLCVVNPSCVEFIEPKRAVHFVGTSTGTFLRDPLSADSRMALAISGQKILGTYTYSRFDVMGDQIDVDRALVFLAGESPDYLVVTDFVIKAGMNSDDGLHLYYGVCAPGMEFSTLLMRAWDLRDRTVGLLYTRTALIDFDAPELRNLTLDLLCTNVSRFTAKAEPETTLQKAHLMATGPRIKAELTKVNSDKLYKDIIDRFASISREYL